MLVTKEGGGAVLVTSNNACDTPGLCADKRLFQVLTEARRTVPLPSSAYISAAATELEAEIVEPVHYMPASV